jgi:hypothetical protein
MSADPKECREQAKRCLRLAAEANDPVLRDSLTDTAHRWERLAAELQSDNDNLARQNHAKRD